MRVALSLIVCVGAFAGACTKSSGPTAPPTTTVPPFVGPDGSTLNVTAPTPASPINNAQVSTSPMLTASASTGAATSALQYRFELFDDAGARVELSPLVSTPSYQVTSAVDFDRKYSWRARAESQGLVGPWSSAASFVGPLGGYIRTGEVYDPLVNGRTVGERIGQTAFVAQGIRVDNTQSYVRYLIPGTVRDGEFSVEVSGLRPNNNGDKLKVMSMSSGAADFIVDPFRVDVQYRGNTGFPPNAITFRCLYGSADDLDVRYEPDSTTRFNSVHLLDPNTVYHWKFTWGDEVRVQVRAGGVNGTLIYNVGVRAEDGTYNPNPWYAYLGAPTGRSGAESASVPGAVYKNVWISNRARPASR